MGKLWSIPPGNVYNNNFYSWLISRITSYIQDFSIRIWFWIWCCCRWGSSGRSPPVYNNNFYSSLPRPTHLLTIANCYTTESHNLTLQQNCLPREHKTIPKDFWEPHVAPKRAGVPICGGGANPSQPSHLNTSLGTLGNWEERIEDPITLISAICEWRQFRWKLQ